MHLIVLKQKSKSDYLTKHLIIMSIFKSDIVALKQSYSTLYLEQYKVKRVHIKQIV